CHATELLARGRHDRPAEQVIGGVRRAGETGGNEYAQQQPMGLHGVSPGSCLCAQRVAGAGTAFRYAMMASISARARECLNAGMRGVPSLIRPRITSSLPPAVSLDNCGP